MLSDLCGIGLPAGREFVHENYVVGIAHRNRCPAHFAKCNFDREFISDLWLAHGGLEFESAPAVRSQRTGFDSCTGSNFYLLTRRLPTKICSNAPRSVAGYFRV